MENPMVLPYEWSEEAWKELIASVVRYTVQPGEEVKDIVAGGWALGRYRGKVIGRDFYIPEDVPYGLSIFCLYPFKPPVPRENYEYLLQNRWKLFEGASQDEFAEERFANVVPRRLLRLDLHQLFGLLQTVPIREIIQF
jgi:hypothetical protein